MLSEKKRIRRKDKRAVQLGQFFFLLEKKYKKFPELEICRKLWYTVKVFAQGENAAEKFSIKGIMIIWKRQKGNVETGVMVSG